MKILSLVGARPQFMQEAVLHRIFKKKNITEVLVDSGQHYDFNMSGVFIEELEITKPHYSLNVGSGSHAAMTGKIMILFEKVALKEMPDVIVVNGDTNTTLAGALVGAKLKIPVAHVEAGIRMEPKDMPEEINRVLIDRISTFLFCPSKTAIENLKKEGIEKGVYLTGDVMYDLFLRMEGYAKYEVFHRLKLEVNNFILVTLHRDYNVDTREILEGILKVFQRINNRIKLVFPIHPRTYKNIKKFNLQKYLRDMMVIEPLDYLNTLGLIKKAIKVITDSGGLQKEAYYAKKQTLVVMPDAGWVELIQNKWNTLCNRDNLYTGVFRINRPPYVPNIYGMGDAGERIADILLSYGSKK